MSIRCLILATMALTFPVACRYVHPTPLISHAQAYKGTFKGITPEGFVMMEDGATWRLKGVRMRSSSDTQEDELLTVIERIVTRRRADVRVFVSSSTGSAVVYYDQIVAYRDAYGPYYLVKLFGPRTMRKSANELLIIMGAARLDPAELDSSEWSDTLRRAQEESSLAGQSQYQPLAFYEKSTPFLYVYQLGGFRARLTKGDLERVRQDLLEAEQYRQRMAEREPAAERSGLIAAGMASENRYIRRYVVRELPRSAEMSVEDVAALIQALDHDPDRYVRADAATSLGNVAERKARDALKRALSDPARNVREAASKALRDR